MTWKIAKTGEIHRLELNIFLGAQRWWAASYYKIPNSNKRTVLILIVYFRYNESSSQNVTPSNRHIINRENPKKAKKGGVGGRGGEVNGWGYTFLKGPSGSFRFVTLSLENPGKQAFTHWKLCEVADCVKLLRSSKIKKQDPWEFHMSFSWTPLEIQLLFIWTLEFSHVLSSIPLKFPWPQASLSLFGFRLRYSSTEVHQTLLFFNP